MPVLVLAVVGVGVLTGWIWGPINEVAKVLAAVAGVVVSMLPDAADLGLTIPGGWITGYTWLNSFLPLTEALALVSIFVGIMLALLAFRVAVIIYHLAPKPGMGT